MKGRGCLEGWGCGDCIYDWELGLFKGLEAIVLRDGDEGWGGVHKGRKSDIVCCLHEGFGDKDNLCIDLHQD